MIDFNNIESLAAPNRRKPAKKIGSESPKKVDLKRSMTKRTIGPANSKIYESREQAVEAMENKGENKQESNEKPPETPKNSAETPAESKPDEKKTEPPAKAQHRGTKRALPTPPKKSTSISFLSFTFLIY